MDKRPDLNKEISIKDFKDFYWLKEELVKFCRTEGLKSTGGKIEISKRIENYIQTNQTSFNEHTKKVIQKSKFDWGSEKLTVNTIITDNYKNTENVREFFKNQIGDHFKFNVRFMNWMKSNCGKTLKDAVIEWVEIKSSIKNKTNNKEIAPQFEYNRYLKDFLADNPNSKRELGIRLWKIKKTLRGNNKYIREDLKLIEKTKNES